MRARIPFIVALARTWTRAMQKHPRRARSRPAWLGFLMVAFLALASGCRQDQASATAGGVSYVLEWKTIRARPLIPGAGFEVTNDLGFVVRVRNAHVVTRSIELVPCSPQSPVASRLGTIEWLISPRPAFAGHSALADPSATKQAQVEAVSLSALTQLAMIPVGIQEYCRVHYLIARADAQAAGLPAADLVDQTLRIDGSFRSPAGSSFEPFTVATAVANGKLFELTSPLKTGGRPATIVVRRNLDTIFDRVDFTAMPEKRIAREILQNLVDGAEIEVRTGRDAG